MRVGYARVSRSTQQEDLQISALKKAGCEKIFDDVATGKKFDRSGLQQALEYAQKGDTLVVWKLDRLGRSLKHLIITIEDLGKRGIGFISLTESIDTTNPYGELIFQIIGAIAQFERAIISERTAAGLAAAKELKGHVPGKPHPLPSDPRVIMAKQLIAEKKTTREIAKTIPISRTTLFKWLADPLLGLR